MEQFYQSVCRGEFTESLTTMSGLFAVIALSVFTDISHNGVMLLSLLCITVSGSCWYHLSVISVPWSLQMLQWRYATASLRLEMYSVLGLTSGYSIVQLSLHIVNTFCICRPLAGLILLSGSFWCLLPGLELRQVVPLFFLSDYLTTICWWWPCLLEASLESWDTGHEMFWFPLFFVYGFHLRLEYVF